MGVIAFILAFLALGCLTSCRGNESTEFNIFNDDCGFSYSYLESWIPEWKDGMSLNGNFHFKLQYYPKNLLFNDKKSVAECEIVILTAGNEDFNTLVELEKNRIEYSRKHDYCYIHFSCNDNIGIQKKEGLNIDDKICKYPHFWRYLAMWKLFTKKEIIDNSGIQILTNKIKWVLYMDLDAMFTNFEFKIEKLIENYSISTTGLIIAADTKCYIDKYPLNNGVMLIRNSKFSKQLAFQILSKYKYKDSLLFDGVNRWNAKGLKDQPILTNILVEDKKEIDSNKIMNYCLFAMNNNLDLNGIIQSTENIIVVSPRIMNSVRRSFTHFRKDNALWHWRSRDWIAHLSGLTPMASALRRKYIKQVCDSSPIEVCPFQI
ncbi:hypothetical protein FG379_000601 [Cryptosporidium bovis]|uniref:uncharacterized protein n=1 Tax=Cryptosporidium bovis TaxID=310047 RepID=UPI00351A840B|nr:hypothetical protein FG379_000601 [Cryptosporidium bovis]